MIKLYICPAKNSLPDRGGVREHVVQLYRFAEEHPHIELVSAPHLADIVHTQSVYTCGIRNKPVIYTCHGGFIPKPIASVFRNLKQADIVVSVASWLVDKHIPSQYHGKTVVIPNGIDKREFEAIPSSHMLGRYILYAKEYPYHLEEVYTLAQHLPHAQFRTTVELEDFSKNVKNVISLGLQDRDKMRSLLNDSMALLLTGSEVCPTMLLEAWSCGVPIIGVDKHGIAELMRINNEVIGGALYTDNSARSMIQAAKHVLANSYRLGQEGKERVKVYDWHVIFDAYYKLYLQLVESDTVAERTAMKRYAKGALWVS